MPGIIRNAARVVGYFSHDTSKQEVLCDGDACIISGTEERMRFYLETMMKDRGKGMIIKKTRFGEIMAGLMQGAAYAFDEKAYARFHPLMILNGVEELPTMRAFSKEDFPQPIHFLRITMVGL